MITAEIKEEYNKVVSLRVEDINKLHQEISSAIGEGHGSEFSLKYSDGSLIKTDTISNVINDENLRDRKIQSLEMTYDRGNKKVKLLFGNKENHVELVVEGPDMASVRALKSTIDHRLKSLFKSRLRTVPSLILSFFITTFIFYVVYKIFFANNPQLSFYVLDSELNKVITEEGNTVISFIGWAWFFIFIIYSSVTIIFTAYLFPNLSFLVGQGQERDERRSQILGKVFWVLGVGTVVSILGPIFYSFLLQQ